MGSQRFRICGPRSVVRKVVKRLGLNVWISEWSRGRSGFNKVKIVVARGTDVLDIEEFYTTNTEEICIGLSLDWLPEQS